MLPFKITDYKIFVSFMVIFTDVTSEPVVLPSIMEVNYIHSYIYIGYFSLPNIVLYCVCLAISLSLCLFLYQSFQLCINYLLTTA